MRTTSAIRNDRATVARLLRGFCAPERSNRVETMARAACFSRRQFHRLMLRVLGETPGTHQRRIRLDRAGWLLLTSGATVLDIALETGFENHETNHDVRIHCAAVRWARYVASQRDFFSEGQIGHYNGGD